MNDSTVFELIVRSLWDADEDNGFIIQSVVSIIHGRQRMDHDNALSVLALVFPDAKIIDVHISDTLSDLMEEEKENAHIRGNDALIFTVKFADDSKGIITTNQYGVGCGFERIS